MSVEYDEKYLCSAERAGKITDVAVRSNNYSVMEYRKIWEAKGFDVSVSKICSSAICYKKDTESSNIHTNRIPTGKWEKKVMCLETERVYATIKECMKETGIGGFRMRKAIYQGAAINGMHFKIVEN